MNAVLVMFKADGSRRDFPVKGRHMIVGRTNSCDLRIPLSAVSRQHCEIWIENGKMRLRDLGSSNGTFHNRRRVTEATLRPGDEIGIGPVQFTVVIDGKPEEVSPTAAGPAAVSERADHAPLATLEPEDDGAEAVPVLEEDSGGDVLTKAADADEALPLSGEADAEAPVLEEADEPVPLAEVEEEAVPAAAEEAVPLLEAEAEDAVLLEEEDSPPAPSKPAAPAKGSAPPPRSGRGQPAPSSKPAPPPKKKAAPPPTDDDPIAALEALAESDDQAAPEDEPIVLLSDDEPPPKPKGKKK